MNRSPANGDESTIRERLSTLRVLAVDDHEINRQFLRAGVGRHVGSLMLAGNGYQAVELSRNHRFDLVLMDLHMPDMDGLSAWRKILDEAGPESVGKVIALTADSREEERERLRQAGFHGFLTKPVEIDKLVQAMARVIDGKDGFIVDDDSKNPRRSILLDDKRALRASGSSRNAARLQMVMLEELQHKARRLDNMLAEGAFEQAVELLHQWKGAAGYVGANQLEQAAELLEQSLENDLDSSPGVLYLNLVRSLEATRQILAITTGSHNNGDRSA